MHTERLWSRNFILLCLSNTFLFLSFDMLLPTLPLYVAEKGGSDTEIGMIMGVFTITAILIRPFSKVGSNKMGEKMLLVCGVILCLLATGSYASVATVVWLLAVRLLHGLGFGIATTMYGTVSANLIPAERRGEGMGYFGMGTTIASSIGPFLGIGLIEGFGYTSVFLVSALLLLLAAGFTLLISESNTLGEAREWSNNETPKLHDTGVISRLIEPKAIFPSLLSLFLGIWYGGILSFITLFGKEVGIGNIGYFFLIIAMCEILIRLVAGKIFDKYGHFWVLIPSVIICLIGSVQLAFTSNLWMLLLSGVCVGFGFGAIFPALQAWIINLVEPNRRVTATATFYNFFDLGIGGGALLLGFIAGLTDYSTMYLYSSLCFVLFLVVYLFYIRRERGAKYAVSAADSETLN